MNAVDVLVVVIVVLLVLAVIFCRYVLPKILNRRVKNKKESDECNSCANCKRH